MNTGDGTFHRPYTDETRNFLYNLMFCDNRELFRPKEGEPKGHLALLFAEPLRSGELRELAEEAGEESRYRALAFNRLRQKGAFIADKVVLGTIVEVALPEGLDALAGYEDGRVRYLNHAGAPAIFEGGPPEIVAKAKELIQLSKPIVNKIKPWEAARRAPPIVGHARLTFVVSDGLYFGEGNFGALSTDAMSGPVIRCAGELLTLVVDVALKK